MVQNGIANGTGIQDRWILLDTCSSTNTSNNINHDTDIVSCYEGDEMVAMTNVGIYRFDQQTKLKLLPMDIHFDQNSLATVISYHSMAALPNIRIMVDTSVEDVINVVMEDK